MWKAIYCYIISTIESSPLIEVTHPNFSVKKRFWDDAIISLFQ